MTQDYNHKPFFFIQMSDPQFGMLTANADFAGESVLFAKAVAQANRLNPAFIVLTGDLINVPANELQTSAAWGVWGRLKPTIKTWFLPGNHDIGDAPTPETLLWYRRRIGKDWYSFNQETWHFIALNSCIIFNSSHAEQEMQNQWSWLQHDLQQSQARYAGRIMVFMHHSLFLQLPDEPDDQYFNIPLACRRQYLELFHRYHVAAVIAGHRHLNRQGTDGLLQMITTAPVGMPLGNDPSGFRIVRVYPDHFDHQYYGLDNVPEKIEL